MSFIEVNDLSKEYRVLKKETGVLGEVKSILFPKYDIKCAVKDISFSINKGEKVGYIGMNGAGKSTTIKMMTGILMPTAGSIKVNGLVPYESRMENARQMGVVFGQRSRLNWDLPIMDSFELYRRIYDIEKDKYRRNVSHFIDALDMGTFLDRPVRQLSLGEKMRANLAVAFLHDPTIVYLDEPTIGLDVVAKNKVREFIKEMNEEKNVTIMLTTHDMYDIESICSRMIFLHDGKILYDGALTQFKEIYGKGYVMEVECAQPVTFKDFEVDSIKEEGNKYVICADRDKITPEDIIYHISSQGIPIKHLDIHEASIESVIVDFYRGQHK